MNKPFLFDSVNVSWCVTGCHTLHVLATQLYLRMFLAMRHWSGVRPLASPAVIIQDLLRVTGGPFYEPSQC